MLSLLGYDSPSSTAAWFNLDQLAPPFIIRQAINDWFAFVHPVAPILHRDTFLRQLDDPAGSSDLDFLMLVVSVCAATVSTLRRSAAYTGAITVEKCYQIITTTTQSRGILTTNLTRCQTKYNMAASLMQERGMDNEMVQLLSAEILVMTGHLLHYEAQHLSLCELELVKRLYWLCFSGQWSVDLQEALDMVSFAFTF